MHSQRTRSVIAALLAVFALGGVTAAAAQAEEAPFWTVNGSRLASGQTRFITAKLISTNLTIDAPSLGIAVKCEALALKEGVLSGSNAGEPGTGNQAIELAKCKQEGNGTSCTVAEPIVTTSLRKVLVLDPTRQKLLVWLFPLKGAKWTTIKFNGTCSTIKEMTVEGSLAGEVTNTEEVPVELPNKKIEATSWYVRYPATPIKKIWSIKGGVGKEEKVELTAATEPATLSAVLLITLLSKENWSPLP